MKHLPSLLLFAVAFLLLNCSSDNKQEKEVDPEVMTQQLDSLLQNTVSQADVAGVAVAVVSADKVLYSKAFGVSNVDNGETLRTDHLFNFTSIVKTFTATAIMREVDKGNLALDKTAFSYWKEPFQNLELPTLRQMLSHSSGLQFTEKAPATNGTLEAGDLRLANVPGYKLQYSNAAFYSLGQLIAHKTDISFSTYVKDEILSALGMNHTSVSTSETPEGTAPGHSFEDDQLVPITNTSYTARKTGNGVLYSTIEDMAIWAQMHLNRGSYQGTEILKKESYQELWKPNLETGWDPMKAAAGLGCFIGKVGEYPSVSHIGGGNGYSAAFVLLPGQDRGIVIAGNSDKLPREALIATIVDIIL